MQQSICKIQLLQQQLHFLPNQSKIDNLLRSKETACLATTFSLYYMLKYVLRPLWMVAQLLVIPMRRHPVRACPPRNHVLIEITNQIRKITKTTTNTWLRNRLDYLHFLQLHPPKTHNQQGKHKACFNSQNISRMISWDYASKTINKRKDPISPRSFST